MRGGVSWTPFAAAAAAVPLLGAGAAPWLAAPAAAAMMAVAAAVVARWRARRHIRSVATAEVVVLRQALVRRDEQLARTVHELRTPLASVITALELLRSSEPGAPGEAAELAATATLAARQLAFLVDDVLDEQALTSGTLRLAIGSHRVRDLLGEGLRTLELQAAERGAEIRTGAVDDSLAIRTDPRRFLQILFNLLGNAMKFTPKGEPIDIQVEARGNRVRFGIRDHGPGVPPELQGRLFSRLTGNDPRTPGDQSGNGLGLFVTGRLVQQMGGRIGLECPPAGGSLFWFELPRAEPRATNSEIAPMAGRAR